MLDDRPDDGELDVLEARGADLDLISNPAAGRHQAGRWASVGPSSVNDVSTARWWTVHGG